jgi:NAD(P)-dependent dehydrogenase (short-subunit alcohol dehydrogenase family)
VAQLLARGYDVEAWFVSNEKAAADLETRSMEHPGILHTRQVDVTVPAAINDALATTKSVDLFVHAAGAIIRPASWDEASVETTRQTIELNLTSAIWIARAVAPKMQRRGSGHIVFLSSSYAIGAGAAPVLAYTAAKAGLTAVTRGLAAELGDSGVRVNAVAPSNVDTAMTQSAGEDTVNWAISTTPLGRLAEPDEIAHLILSVHDNNYITGNVIIADGGQTLKI